MKALRGILACSLVLSVALLVACGDDATTTPDPIDGGNTDASTTPPPPAPMASWDLESDLSVNGARIDESVQSVTAERVDHPTGPGLRFTITTAPELCALRASGGCAANGETEVNINLYADAPGTYPLSTDVEPEAGTFNLYWRTIERDCIGAGFGPSTGTLTVRSVDEGSVEYELDVALELVGATPGLSGSVTAPFCDE